MSAPPGASRPAAHNLPAALNSFIGRNDERNQVGQMLGAYRLVTLAGAPGVGKTRLALEVADDAVDEHGDGVWLVELGPVAEPDLVPQAVASVLGIPETRGVNLVDSVAAHLADKRLVLVLDNCEHLLRSTAKVAASLLRACRGLVILATSREPLGIDGEYVWRVQPFAVPVPGETSVESLLDCSAVRLFLDRAAAIRPGFRLTAAEAAPVAEICRSLDGVPLAIELAAARMEALSPDEIVRHLDHRLRLLGIPSRTEPSIHQTLEATLDWSHKLLHPAEATLLARLSVFADTWNLDAAEAICSGGEIPCDEVFGLLDALVRKSLVTAVVGGQETRFRLLGIIRDHAGHRLGDSAERTSTRDAHCRWYVAQAEAADADHGDRTVPLLSAERENLRAAFEWAMAQGYTDSALKLATSLVSFWHVRGDLEEGSRWLSRALGVSAEEPPRLRAKALWAAGFVGSLVGDMADAVPLAEESIALARDCRDASVARRAQTLLAVALTVLSPLAALPLLESNVAMAREEGDVRFLMWSLDELGAAHLLVGDAPAARLCIEESLRLARLEGDSFAEEGELGALGRAALIEGDYATAEARLQEALSISRALDHDTEIAEALSWLGEVARGRGDLGTARELLQEVLPLTRGATPPNTVVARCLCFQGLVELVERNVDDARSHLQDALELAGSLGRSYIVARCLLGLGEVSLLEGRSTDAGERFEEALALARATGDRQAAAAALHGLADGARQSRSFERAQMLYSEALVLWDQIGDRAGLPRGLEGLAFVAGERDQAVDAVRLLASAQALRDVGGYARTSTESSALEASIARARLSLGGKRFRQEWATGSRLSAGDALAYATRPRTARGRPSTGWASLSPAEHDVACLAARGLTSREIGDRLFISHRTVGAHLGHVYDKLGISSRRHLPPEAYQATPQRR